MTHTLPTRNNRSRPRADAVVLLLLAATLACAGCPRTARNRDAAPKNVAERADVAADWGIEIASLRLTSAGYFLDFRYRVVDAKKAQPLFDGKSAPYVIDQKSGAKFMVPAPPKIGPLRPKGEPLVGRQYFILFANPAKYVKAGDKVTVVIGDFQAKDLVVHDSHEAQTPPRRVPNS